MEFGLFIQNFVPNYRVAVDPHAETHAIFDDLEACIAADAAGFKYVWATEHHFLNEYSHLSANEVVLGYLAARTDRIHLGSGIFNPLPQVNHPAKVAEKAAYLDQISRGRFEFGTGRGAGSHEILGFLPGVESTDATKDIWDDVIREFPKMLTQETYEGYSGKYWSLPPRKILPRPYGPSHPPMWYAAGNTSSYEMAGRMGLGVLGFSLGSHAQADKAISSYKKAIANAQPIGAFVNDNLMSCIAAYVAEDGRKAREAFLAARPTYLSSNVFRYHDTFPRPSHVPAWPELIPDPTPEALEVAIASGAVICGDPDEALEQCQRWASTGVDQLVFGIGPAPLEVTIESVRLLGEHVIPKVDGDPVHRTTRFRQAAAGG